MPHFIITEAKARNGTVTACRVHPIMGGTEGAPEYRKDGGVWCSTADVAAMIAAKDAVFALNERDGHRLPPERVTADGEQLGSTALLRLARSAGG